MCEKYCVRSIFAGNIYIFEIPTFWFCHTFTQYTHKNDFSQQNFYLFSVLYANDSKLYLAHWIRQTHYNPICVHFTLKRNLTIMGFRFFSGSYINTVRTRYQRKLSCLQVIREHWTTSFMWMTWFAERFTRDSIIPAFGYFFITSKRTTSHICLRPFDSHGKPKRFRQLRNTITNVKLDPITSTPYLRAFYFPKQHNTISV